MEVSEPFDVKVNHLTVDVKVGKKQRKRLVDDISFHLKPGTMTLILGAPGCGKTTIFKTLAGQMKKPYRLTGDVLFNDQPANKKTHHTSVAYVTQEDVHFPRMNVRETFKFALDCHSSSSTTEEEKDTRIDNLLRMLDLTHVQNTLVGNELIRGISGGQRKRVTIGVAMTAGPSVVLMDEPTTGLDANTSLEILKTVRKTCDETRVPTIAALLQPSPEICSLFDNLLLLSKGKIAYFGPYKNAVMYFASLGLEGGKFMSDPEFLQEVAQYPYKYIQEGEKASAPKSAAEVEKAYLGSEEYRDVERSLVGTPHVEQFDVEKKDMEADEDERTYPVSFWGQVRLNIKREYVLLRRDMSGFRSRMLKKVIVGLIVGSLFYQLPLEQTGLRTRNAVLFFAQLFLAMGNVGALSSFFDDRKIFYVQRGHKYYSPATYFMSKTIVEIPMIIMECLILGVIVYWMCALNPAADRFIFFLLVLIVTDFFSVNFCRFISAWIGSEQVANTIVPAIYGTLVLFAGFIISPADIPDWWIWIHYLSVFHYGFEATLINEFVGQTYTCTPTETVPPSFDPRLNLPYPVGFSGNSVCPLTRGEQELIALEMHTEFYWRWVDLAIVMGYAIFFLLVTYWGMVRNTFTEQQVQIVESTSQITIEEKTAEKDQATTGVYMSWENLSYAVEVKKGKRKEKLTLLNNISGYVRPGMLMALMGPSGAGKSTLLDVLGNRKTGGFIEGKVLVNGKPRDSHFNRFTGYIEQQDILMQFATIYETILFSAENRLPKELTKEQKVQKVEDVLHILDLGSIRHLFAKDLTMEQKKRLTIGVELVTDPQLLFLDEPTSGLDSQAASTVMDVVKRVAATGRSVICTIHQPSAAVFTCFDHVLLLKRGGETVYFGPTGKDCEELLGYFAGIGWHCEAKRNPADFILDVAAASIDESGKSNVDGGGGGVAVEELEEQRSSVQRDPATAYQESALRRTMEADLHYIPPGFAPPELHGKYASSLVTQLRTNLRRSFTSAMRKREDIRARVMRFIMTSILVGTTYLLIDTDQAGLNARFSAFFFTMITAATSANGLIPTLVSERAVFYREQASGTYSTVAYLNAILVSELPLTLFSTLLFCIPIYFLIGLRPGAEHFFFFVWIAFIYSVLQLVLVFTICMATPSTEVAQGVVGVSMILFTLFAGFMIIKPNIPDWWIWLYYISFMHYPLEAVLINEFDGVAYGCPNDKGAVPVPIPSEGEGVVKMYCPITSGNQFLQAFTIDPADKFNDMGITIGMLGGMLILSFLALRYIRHIKR